MNENLLKFLTQATIMIVSVSASTTQGQNLTSEELERVIEGCEIVRLSSIFSLLFSHQSIFRR